MDERGDLQSLVTRTPLSRPQAAPDGDADITRRLHSGIGYRSPAEYATVLAA
ncbi:hypothetical protein [Kitasatospora sp. NPDC047058]|uniref:hypothetical protein n=1 Tax=Kitasatospora sp. NPDC047058 TaxID=3155620 RepID=UPI0033C86916